MSNSITNLQANGKAQTVKTIFSRETAVALSIQADPVIIWKLLINASDYPRWNSTVISIEGSIAKGNKIRLKSTLSPKQSFALQVSELYPEKSMVWKGGMGSRRYTLQKNTDGSVTFTMNEKIGGLMFPLFAGFIPPFDASFEQFAKDLKKEAETIQSSKN